MGLLRNASGLLIPDASGGKPGRANDPEFHIRRLEHFSKGMGIDLASTNPLLSRKQISSIPFSANTVDLLRFDSHDEGVHLPQGHMNAASDAIMLELGDHPNTLELGNHQKRDEAFRELDHRSPFHHTVRSEPGDNINGIISKAVSDGTNFDLKSQPWKQQSNPQTFKDADNLIRSEFGKQNRNRSVPSTDILELVNRSLQHPAEESIRHSRRQNPQELGPQFLKIGHFGDDIVDHDVVDLETGNWAKIDPEGYFPD